MLLALAGRPHLRLLLWTSGLTISLAVEGVVSMGVEFAVGLWAFSL